MHATTAAECWSIASHLISLDDWSTSGTTRSGMMYEEQTLHRRPQLYYGSLMHHCIHAKDFLDEPHRV